jgi:hypothetical protein
MNRGKKKDRLAAVSLNLRRSTTRKLKCLAFAPGVPLRQRHQFQAEAAVVHSEIVIQGVPNDGIGMDLGNLLRHHADIDGVAPQVAIAVQPKSVVAAADQRDVTLEPDIGRGE